MSFKRFFYLLPFILTMLIIPLSLIGIDKPIGDVIGELREAAQETEQISRWGYLFTQFRVIVTYIRLLFLPINQNLDYDYPVYDSFFKPDVFLSFLFLLLIFGIALYLLCHLRIGHPEPKAKGLRDTSATLQTCPERKACPEHERRNDIKSPTRYTLHPTRLIAFGIFWFFITLSVESSIIPIKDVINEHRLYLPSVGAIIAFSTAVYLLSTRYTLYAIRFVASRFSLTTVFSLLTTVIVVLSIATYQRNLVWQDEVSLWEDVVRKSLNKATGYNNLGIAYDAKGWIDNAIEHYQVALKLKPDYADAYNNLGFAYYYHKGLIDKAIEHYQIAIKLDPDNAKTHLNLGIAYKAKGWLDKATVHFDIARRLNPALFKTNTVYP